MSAKFHVVAIFCSGYLARSAHETIREAYEAAQSDPLRRSNAIVVRDGSTGKRYSMRELEQITQYSIEHRDFGWMAFDKEGKALGNDVYGWDKYSSVIDAILRHYLFLAA